MRSFRLFCSRERRKHYHEATKYQYKCYYEVQCWRGTVDIIIGNLLKMRRYIAAERKYRRIREAEKK